MATLRSALPTPVTPQSLVEQIASRLADDIVTGVYLPGERLKEQDIAARFGTSRAPFREAFRLLERDGLIRMMPWRGVCVTDHTRDEIRELFEIRADLLAMCVQRIVAKGDAAQLAEVRAAIDGLSALTEAGGDERDYKQATAALSAMLSDMTGNRYLHRLVTDFRQRLLWYYCFLGQSTIERRRESNHLWGDMVTAMERGDAWGAAAAAQRVTMATAAIALQLADARAAQPSPA